MPDSSLKNPKPDLPPIREFNDRATLWLLEDPDNLRGLLEICDPGLAALLDFTRAIRINRSFIPADLQKEESDLVYRVPLAGVSDLKRQIWIYVLLEHQSKPDPLVPLRLYLYMGELWDIQRREWEDNQVPAEERRLHLVVPLVFYTGSENWATPLKLSDLMDFPVEFARFVPDWDTLFLSLHNTPAATLPRFSTAVGWALNVLKAEKEPLAEIERVLKQALEGLAGLSDEQAGQWLRVAWYLLLLVFHRRAADESPAMIALIREEARKSKFHEQEEFQAMEMTYAEYLEEKGRSQGSQSSLRIALKTVLTERFGPVPQETLDAIANANPDTLTDWLRIAATAKDLESVGISPKPQA